MLLTYSRNTTKVRALKLNLVKAFSEARRAIDIRKAEYLPEYHALHDAINAKAKPHVVRGFKVSRDSQFVEKLEDIVGLYMSPPEHTLVFCCDEKSQVQALDRTQPGLPLKKGRAETMTHDYDRRKSPWDKRNGTTTLFTPLKRDGKAATTCRLLPANQNRFHQYRRMT